MKHGVIIEGPGVGVVIWGKTRKEADDLMTQWRADNPERPFCRYTLVDVVFSIAG